jgi:hypothetical protein
MSSPDATSNLNTAVVTRRVLFFILLIGLTLVHLLVTFRGISTSTGMDQAQLARELARNNGFTTKVLRPMSIGQSQRATEGEATLVQGARDTYHSPLHPVLLAAVLKVVDGGDADKWRMTGEETVYRLDRVIAATSVILFLLSIGVTYLLVCRIFDSKIAGVTALLMLLCDLFWQYSQSGLPQMFMLLLFTCACFFAFRAVEISEDGGIALVPALIAGLFFALLCLTHWLAIWIVLGWVVYAALAIRPRGVAALGSLVLLLVLSSWFLLKNYEYTGSPGGTALLSIHNGLGGSEDDVMRTYDSGDTYLDLRNLILKILRVTLVQASNLFTNLGGILTAPIFFLTLLHPFKRKSIASFRWGLLLMWAFAALGMAIFGLSNSGVDSNQLHILFAPIMAAYGLAFVAILWSKLDLPTSIPQLRQAHFVIIVLISGGPLILNLPRSMKMGLSEGELPPHWPPYLPSALNTRLPKHALENEIIVSDQPWAVAWYADRTSLWLPKKVKTLELLEGMADSEDTPVTGILISPYSHSMKPMIVNWQSYSEWGPLILDGWASAALRTRRAGLLALQNDEMKGVLARYPNPAPFINGNLLIYWSSQPIPDSGQ